jgi:hypothetical protein
MKTRYMMKEVEGIRVLDDTELKGIVGGANIAWRIKARNEDGKPVDSAAVPRPVVIDPGQGAKNRNGKH